MKNIKQEISVCLQLLLSIGIWIAILIITKTELRINIDALKKLPDVITIYIALYFVFTKWLWRWSILQGWLVPFPDLQGTWRGEWQTTWVDPKTKKVPTPTPLVLVIKQSFYTLSCVMYTEESTSISNAALIAGDEESGIKKLSYNYTNKPDATIRDRSIVHDGAAILSIIVKPKRELEGEYWTSRKSSGTIKVKFESKELVEKFTKSK